MAKGALREWLRQLIPLFVFLAATAVIGVLNRLFPMERFFIGSSFETTMGEASLALLVLVAVQCAMAYYKGS
jgi:hypothetical protein